MSKIECEASGNEFDAIVIGAGFAGMYMLHKFRSLGLTACVLETGSDVGGAWYWNRYPGARCDVESLVYSYSFSPELDAEWRWTERYAAQPEILAYLKFAADRLDLRRDIKFNTQVIRAVFNEKNDRWTIETQTGHAFRARFCIMATGPISVPRLPDIPGIHEFGGELYHTAQWPQQEVDFSRKRVGVIGTGSSGTQLIPVVAKQAERLYVFLRTSNFTVPSRNGPLTEEHYAIWNKKRDEIRAAMWRGEIAGVGDVLMDEELRSSRTTPASSYTPEQRLEIMEKRWDAGGAVLQGSFKDVMTNEVVNAEVADFVRSKIRKAVADPERGEMLIPKGFALGTKRLCVGTDYYETFNRDNVEAVDVKSHPIEQITSNGVRIAGREIGLDVLICASGFDAVTGALTSIDIRGLNGVPLNETWRAGPQTYLGLAIAGFPNMLMIGGPGSPSVLSNVVMTNEFQVEYISELIKDTLDRGLTRIDVRLADQIKWTEHVNQVVKNTLLSSADSWYVGANVPGKPRVILAYTGGVVAYRSACETARANDYAGFERSVRSPNFQSACPTAVK